MIIAHLSDFHISRHGSRLTQLQDMAFRKANGLGWETIRSEGDWRIQHRPAMGFRMHPRLRLVDEMGFVHQELKTRKSEKIRLETMDRLMAFMEARDRTTPQVLAERFPSPTQLDALLFRDPNNINLRFCAVANTMREMNPDHIVVTGDLTDDAEGFELILAGLEPFFEQGRVSFVPGNHDTYASPPLWVAKTHRKSEAEKRMLWATFASSLGQPATGSHIRLLGEGVVLACLDSCHHARVPGSASGLVPLRDLRKVESQLDSKGSQIRLACLHHHVLNPPSRGVGRVPMQAGMRLRNAKQVFTCLKEMGFKLVMNGHRHIGYRFHPPMAPLFLSSPSSTIGCRSGESPFFWRIKVDSEGIHGVEEVPIAANQWVCPTPAPYHAEPSP